MPVAPHDGDRPMPRLLKPPQQHQRQQAADVQAIGRRVKAVSRKWTTLAEHDAGVVYMSLVKIDSQDLATWGCGKERGARSEWSR